MSAPAIVVEQMSKKFRKGELHDSLRDLIPALVVGLWRGGGRRREAIRQREFWALRDVSFQVPPGAALGIIGPNGAGKSTLLKLLSRIIRPTSGRCQVRGRLAALIEVGAGFHGDLTGRENIYLSGAILGMRRAEIRAKEASIIEFADMADFMDTPVKRYSSGMAARLGFAVAAHLDPDVLLIDEVLSVGDTRFRAKCSAHIQHLIQSNVTVVFISHMLDQVQALCPNTIVLHHGQMVYQGPTGGAIDAYVKVLSDGTDERAEDAPALLRNIRFCDDTGREVLTWPGRRPAAIEFDLVIRHPLTKPCITVTFLDIRHNYLGAANSVDQGLDTPRAPGTYHLRFLLDPNPLADNNFAVRFSIHDGPNLVWLIRQTLVIAVRGTGLTNELILCDGRWSVLASNPGIPAGLVASSAEPGNHG
jgi:lipopolysaccharide transport system ATP-binding protein